MSFVVTFPTPTFWAVLGFYSSPAYVGITPGNCSNRVSSLVHPNRSSGFMGCSSPTQQQLGRNVGRNSPRVILGAVSSPVKGAEGGGLGGIGTEELGGEYSPVVLARERSTSAADFH